MKDRFGRPITGLRISVTENCNLDCFYCHREGCPESSREMTAEEIGKIIGLAKEFGVRKIKLTGGEPLLREDIVEVVRAAAIPGIKDVSMTTNGTMLAGLARELAGAGLARINISLDTLNEGTYERITGKRALREALEGIDAALEAGLKPVKLNMVLLAGVNEHEVEPMIAYTSKRGIILQLIELLDAGGKNFTIYHRDLDDIEQSLRERAVAVRTRRSMQARRKYILPGGEVEVVKPMHNSEFCMHCTRLRLTPDGFLKPCLMRNDNLVDVLSHVRAGDISKCRSTFIEAVDRREPYFKKLVLK
ncbi:MAG: GTP 3',8-cyclase MoaA [Candidatus Hodarchaeaceae archaeon]|nr:GTP 3',8-cyclase MoaA [Candidatus Hodarchaeaceae archaeon]